MQKVVTNNSSKSILPLAENIETNLSVEEAFQRLAHLPNVVFFDSALRDNSLSTYSFIAVDPFQWIESKSVSSTALQDLQIALKDFQSTHCPDLPPFQGGVAGIFGYEFAQFLEDVPTAKTNDLQVPLLAVGLYDLILAFDHRKNKGWIISQGFPETDVVARVERAQARISQMKEWLSATISAARSIVPLTPLSKLAPQYAVQHEGVSSNFNEDAYLEMIRRAVEYIHAGDVFQVNLSQRLLCPAETDSVSLYLKLRESNPAPYAGYFNGGDWQICSSSPERFLTLRNNDVETRPIKGTRGRMNSPEADLFAGNDLRLSEKDRAENVMIVDLLRNDLSKVCRDDSIEVAQLCEIEEYAFVKHLVSIVKGKLREEFRTLDLLKACFPGGSITGAPKIRAMEIIAELEPTVRGAYCGSLTYLGFNGEMDSSILIRTVTACQGWWQLQVGGGIVAQSSPDEEYRETWHKSRGMLNVLRNQS